MSHPIQTSIFDQIAPRIQSLRPGDQYVEVNVSGIALDMDLLKSYFHWEGLMISYTRNGSDTLSGRIKSPEIFNQLMKAWNSIDRYVWEFKHVVK